MTVNMCYLTYKFPLILISFSLYFMLFYSAQHRCPVLYVALYKCHLVIVTEMAHHQSTCIQIYKWCQLELKNRNSKATLVKFSFRWLFIRRQGKTMWLRRYSVSLTTVSQLLLWKKTRKSLQFVHNYHEVESIQKLLSFLWCCHPCSSTFLFLYESQQPLFLPCLTSSLEWTS